MASKKRLWFAVFCFFGVLCFFFFFSPDLCSCFARMIQHGGDLGLDDSHEQHAWWFGLLFVSLLENTENIPTNWMDEGTTEIRK